MAEAFGLVAGAIGVGAAFNNCVTSFEHIQLARDFGNGFERCQIQLDTSKNLI